MAHTYRIPIGMVSSSLVAGAFLGELGLVVIVAGVALASIVAFALLHRERSMLIADYLERHSFPSDTVADVVAGQLGTTSLEEARRRLEAWRNGYLEAEWNARLRRSAAARRGKRISP